MPFGDLARGQSQTAYLSTQTSQTWPVQMPLLSSSVLGVIPSWFMETGLMVNHGSSAKVETLRGKHLAARTVA